MLWVAETPLILLCDKVGPGGSNLKLVWLWGATAPRCEALFSYVCDMGLPREEPAFCFPWTAGDKSNYIILVLLQEKEEHPPKSLFHSRWTQVKALLLTLLACLLGNKLPGETAAISSVGLFNSLRDLTVSFCKSKFSFAQAWCRGGQPDGIQVCISFVGWQDRARVAGTGRMVYLPSCFHGVGLRWVRLVFPLPFRSFPTPACPAQPFSDLSSFPILLSTPHFAAFSSISSPPIFSPHFFLVSNLLPPFWVLPTAVLPARSPNSGHRLRVVSASHLFPLGSLQALLKLPLCIKDIWQTEAGAVGKMPQK